MPSIAIGGIEHYYEIHGSGDPLLLLHGGFCTLETMTAQITSLAAEYRVYAPERVGHGRTADRDGPYSYATMAQETVSFLDALGIADAHVVGFSDGAILGLMLAMDDPQRVRSLVAISGCLDPGWYVDRSTQPVEEPSAGSVAAASEDDAAPAFSVFREAYDRLSPDGPEHGDAVQAKLLALWEVEPQIEPAALSRIVAPTLVLAGDRDSIRTDHTVDIAAAVPGAQLCILPDAGHMVMDERPELVNQVVGEFLARLPTRAA